MLSGIMTALLIVLFLGIVGWAWTRERQQDFHDAALLPLENDHERTRTP